MSPAVQELLSIAVVAAAAGYLAVAGWRFVWRLGRAARGAGCGCGHSCPARERLLRELGRARVSAPRAGSPSLHAAAPRREESVTPPARGGSA